MSTPPRITISVPPWRGYAVPDPDVPGRLTAWWVDDLGAMRGFPTGTRWEPLPPRGTYGPVREDWYASRFWPWKYAVADAILADPETAAARFRVAYPHAVIARTPASVNRANADRDAQRRRYEAITAASRRRRGASVAEVSRHLGTSWATTRTRIAAGEKLLTADPDGARQFVADYLRRALDDDSAEQLAATLLDGDRVDAARIATRQVLAEVGSVSQSQPAGDSAWTHALRAFLAGGDAR